MVDVNTIASILREHVGKANAITSRELAELTRISENDTHATTRKLVLEVIHLFNIPIAASNKGFFFIETREELDEYLQILEGRINEIRRRIDAVTRAYEDFYSSSNN